MEKIEHDFKNIIKIYNRDKKEKDNEKNIDILIKKRGERKKENLQQIIIILSKAYDSEMSDDSMDNNINTFINGVKSNSKHNKLL